MVVASEFWFVGLVTGFSAFLFMQFYGILSGVVVIIAGGLLGYILDSQEKD